MSDLTHLFTINQNVIVKLDGKLFSGIVTKTASDHIIVNVEGISDHLYFEQNFNMDCVYPVYNAAI